ncbi:alpha/beta hydrolase [Candidatus Methylomirabilis sp.]|uniref:alpha/beta fold hydrolase n=1 Tax=Candidatus Methylomirabilis sp. TaxID=2032687 RepID=UPI002A60BB1F|nr:alpha/beta hydrolase [Candidatus Methylomirabilis sp.]
MPKVRVGQIELFYQEDGHCEPIVWIHGLGIDHRVWALQIPLFSRHFRCLTFDNRDAGQSDRSPGSYTIKTMADDVIRLMDTLAIDHAHIVGLSMGGAIAQELTITHPARVKRLVLVSTYTSSDRRGADVLHSFALMRARFSRQEYARATSPWVFTYQNYRTPGLVDLAIARFLEDPYFTPADVYARQVEAALSHNAEDRLSRIAAPTLIVVGDDDILTPMRFARILHVRIPDARLAVIQGGGHALVLTHAEEFNRVVLAFLKEP